MTNIKVGIFLLGCFVTIVVIIMLGRWEQNITAGFKPMLFYEKNSNNKTTEFIDLNLKNEQMLAEALKNASNQVMNILMWTSVFNARPKPPINATKCGACKITYDRKAISDPATKAVVFHFFRLKLKDMPQDRRKDQLYIWYSLESPQSLRTFRKITYETYDNVFNATMSYRRDSDIYFPYRFFPDYLFPDGGPISKTQRIDDIIAKKKHLAILLVSNCGNMKGARLRLKVAKGLEKAGLILEKRGKCFGNKIKTIDVIKEYKFYLAFENSLHCKDYMTEKFFHNGFHMGAVPVVWGATKKDYEAVAPPRSFIFVEDFKNQTELVQYLNYLDKNDAAYREYFKWRTEKPADVPEHDRAVQFCQLCRIMHGINMDNKYNPRYEEMQAYIPDFGYPTRPRVVQSLDNWYYKNESKECFQN